MERLTRNEYIAMGGAAVVIISLFLKWYASVSDRAEIADTIGKGSYSGWDVHTILRFILLAAAVAPFILGYIIVRDHKLSWARGEMTAVIAIVAFGLIVYNGVIDRPGDPSGQIELRVGWYLALLGSIAMVVGSALRSTQSGQARKPPGVL